MSLTQERRVLLLGSTGSIGTQTLDVIDHLNGLHGRGGFPQRFRVVGLATGRNAAKLTQQAARLGVKDLALADEAGRIDLPGVAVRRGRDAAEQLVREVDCDIVLGAMVGSAGLPATLAAVGLGRDVALANKETLVAAGELVIPAARASGSRLLPVDSEHAAVWQCLASAGGEGAAGAPPIDCPTNIAKVVLTASGGPFRTWSKDRVRAATPAEALKHPTWSMGPKVTIDSASLTNKALEVIEAHWLFGLCAQRIGVVVHPQSIVHALVEYADGNVIAQLAPPDMRTPIQYALTWPQRPPGRAKSLDWRALSKLEFEPPDLDRFPALGLGYEVIRRGGTAGAVFNAANEAAVEAFLGAPAGAPGAVNAARTLADGAVELACSTPLIAFGEIAELTARALREVGVSPLRSLDDALAADAEARRYVRLSLGAAV